MLVGQSSARARDTPVKDAAKGREVLDEAVDDGVAAAVGAALLMDMALAKLVEARLVRRVAHAGLRNQRCLSDRDARRSS